jgi:N-acyl-phosphatidylethanolamine-hydrolysing phospholipase D
VAWLLAILLMSTISPGAMAQAPRDGDRFVNLAGRGERGNFLTVKLPFFLGAVGRSFRTPDDIPQLVAYDPTALQSNPGITWIGHSTFLVRFDGASFLTDPIFSERASPFAWAGPKRLVPPGVPLAALPHVDFAVISHDHYDHADMEAVAALAARGVRFVVPLRMGELIRQAGGEAIELDWGQSVELAGVRIHCVPAQHFSGRWVDDTDHRLWAGFVVEGPTTRFFHAGDTGYFDGFRAIGERFGPIDIAAVPVGAYEPLAMMRWVHMTPEEAVQAAVDVGANYMVPMHYGTFELTEESFGDPPRRFLAEMKRRGFDRDRAWVLKVGETRRWGEVDLAAR